MVLEIIEDGETMWLFEAWTYRHQTKEAAREAKAYADRYKREHGCALCGTSNDLTFHHRDPREKLFNIGESYGRGLERIRKEIAKCTVLCDDCHRGVERQKQMRTNFVNKKRRGKKRA